MSRFTEHGYTLSLHKVSEDPEHGFGYRDDYEAALVEQAALWNSYTQETCPHEWCLHGATCQLCGNQYLISRLTEDGWKTMTQESKVTAELAEHYNWLTFTKLRGFVFSRDSVRLNGMITVELGDVHKSFENDWKRYSTMNATVVYGEMVDSKDNRIIDYIEWGPFSDLTKEEALGAIEAALETVDA